MIDFDIQREGDVMTHQLETRVGLQVRNICFGSGKKLSTHKTSCPSATNRSQRWDPKNPEPPVINILFLNSS